MAGCLLEPQGHPLVPLPAPLPLVAPCLTRPLQGSVSSSLQSLVVGGQQLVAEEDSWGRKAGAAATLRGFLEFPSDDGEQAGRPC